VLGREGLCAWCALAEGAGTEAGGGLIAHPATRQDGRPYAIVDDKHYCHYCGFPGLEPLPALPWKICCLTAAASNTTAPHSMRQY